jgi:3-hydroxyisobutyrate dehydrogenase-like beta-hydroxyacid dehydrogenase
MDVGVIGLGTMGGRMAEALVAAGYRVFVHDVSPEALERAVANGAEQAGSPAQVAEKSAIVLLSLPGPAQVLEVVAGEEGLLSRPTYGLIIADTSTVDPATTRQLAEKAAGAGAGYLDAPVLGRPDACGSWTMPVGGEAETLERARPVLERLATDVVHAGTSGAANAIKLLNNLMFGAINAITAEVFAAAPKVGVSPEAFYEIVSNSPAATVSPLFRHLGSRILEKDFSPNFSLALLHKDNRLAMAMLDEAEAPAIVGSAVTALNTLALAAGHGPEDTAATMKVYEEILVQNPPPAD